MLNGYVIKSKIKYIDYECNKPMCFDSLNASGIFLVKTAYIVHTTISKIG